MVFGITCNLNVYYFMLVVDIWRFFYNFIFPPVNRCVEKISNILNDLETWLFSKYWLLGTTVWKCGLKLYLSTTNYRIPWLMEYTKASDMPGSAKTWYLSVLWSVKHIWMKKTLTWKIKNISSKQCTTNRIFFSFIRQNSSKYWSTHLKVRRDTQSMLLLL